MDLFLHKSFAHKLSVQVMSKQPPTVRHDDQVSVQAEKQRSTSVRFATILQMYLFIFQLAVGVQVMFFLFFFYPELTMTKQAKKLTQNSMM